MKKAKALLLMGALASIVACQQDNGNQNENDIPINFSAVLDEGIQKIFILNEGGDGSNNASLDVIDLKENSFTNGIFKKSNPDIGAGLGDVANDMAIIGDDLWIVVNNSNLVEIISAIDYKEIKAVEIPSPRCIAFDYNYAYVTSLAGSYSSSDGQNNTKGKVYRINLNTKEVEGSVEVGYQPEGIAKCGDYMYVANSGWIMQRMAPDYKYDNTVSVIDIPTFTVSKTITVCDNLQKVYYDEDYGFIYVTSNGVYSDKGPHSSIYEISSEEHFLIANYISASTMYDNALYWYGNEQEYDWSNPNKQWKSYKYADSNKTPIDLTPEGSAPYGLCAVAEDTFLIGDAGDYYNPGTVSLYHHGSLQWTVTAGVCPGHFAVYR